MPNLFKHEKTEDHYFLFVEIEGETRSIYFHNNHSPYSGAFSTRGGRYEEEIESREIGFSKDEKIQYLSKVGNFSSWAVEAEKEVKEFLEVNNIKLSDIKIGKVSYPTPEESIVPMDLTVLF